MELAKKIGNIDVQSLLRTFHFTRQTEPAVPVVPSGTATGQATRCFVPGLLLSQILRRFSEISGTRAEVAQARLTRDSDGIAGINGKVVYIRTGVLTAIDQPRDG